MRNRWVVGASDWLAGENGSKENDKLTYGYSDHEWNFIWNSMVEDGAWAVPSIKDKAGNIVKENHAPEFFIKFIAHDLQCNIIVFDLFNKTVEFCSGNQLLDNNVKFESPLLLYTTGSHFQSLVPRDHEYFIHYAKELECKYAMGSLSTRNIVAGHSQTAESKETESDNSRSKMSSKKEEIIPTKRARLEDIGDTDDATVSKSTEGKDLSNTISEKMDYQKIQLKNSHLRAFTIIRKGKENQSKNNAMCLEISDNINIANGCTDNCPGDNCPGRQLPRRQLPR